MSRVHKHATGFMMERTFPSYFQVRLWSAGRGADGAAGRALRRRRSAETVHGRGRTAPKQVQNPLFPPQTVRLLSLILLILVAYITAFIDFPAVSCYITRRLNERTPACV